MISNQRWGMNATCCEVTEKTAVEQANVLATINHTSVVSWMHTNLYVLDLCGRSNLTKTIPVLVVGGRTWLMRTTYIRASERVRRKGETELEDTVKWQIDGGRLRGERNWKKGDYLIHYPTTPWPSNALHPDFLLNLQNPESCRK